MKVMRSIAAASGKPRELVVKIELPELSSAATIDLDITERKLCLTEPTAHYALELPLPAAVLADVVRRDHHTQTHVMRRLLVAFERRRLLASHHVQIYVRPQAQPSFGGELLD